MKNITKYFVGTQEAKKDLLHLIILILVYIVAAWVINIVAGILSFIPLVNVVIGIIAKICIIYLSLCIIVAILTFFKLVD